MHDPEASAGTTQLTKHIRDTTFKESQNKTRNESKGILNKEQIVRNVPAREWGPYTLDENYNKIERKGATM